MLTKEPEMLQPDAFCEHTMQQNATVKGERERRGRERDERGREGGEWEGGEVNSDAQLGQGRRLAKAGPEHRRKIWNNLPQKPVARTVFKTLQASAGIREQGWRTP